MSTYDEAIAGLQAKLAGLSGPDRASVLRELAAAHLSRHNLNPGNPAGLPDLSAAIDAWREIYDGLPPDDPHRFRYAGVLGLYLTVRERTHTKSSADRTQAVAFLEEALGGPEQSPTALAMYRFSLAQYHLAESMREFDAAKAGGSAFQTGASPEARAMAQRTVALLDQGADQLDGANPQLVTAVDPLRRTAQAWSDMLDSLGSGFGDIDFPRLAQAMAALQQFANDARAGLVGFPARASGPAPAHIGPGIHVDDPWPSVAELLSQVSPRDFPTLVVGGGTDDGDDAPLATASPTVPAAPAVDLAALRRNLLATLAGEPDAGSAADPAGGSTADPAGGSTAGSAGGSTAGSAGGSAQEAARQISAPAQHGAVADLTAPLWRADGPVPPTAVIDRAVALATTLVDEAEPDPAAAAVDRFLLATALQLRDRDDDGGGWDADPRPGETVTDDDVDLRASAGHLLAAMAGLPPGHPVSVLFPQALCALLDRRSPLTGVLGRSDLLPDETTADAPATDATATDATTAESAGDVAEALRAVGADLLVRLYRLPADGAGVPRVGMLLLHPQTARVDLAGPVLLPADPAGAPGSRFGTWLRSALDDRLTSGRIVLVVPADSAADAPPTTWSAARDAAGRHLVADLTLSYAASVRQVIELTRRRRLPVTHDPVFIVNPRGDREWASAEAMVLRRMFHPRSTGLGRLVEQVDGAARPDRLLAHLPGRDTPGSGLLHVDCGLVGDGDPRDAVPGHDCDPPDAVSSQGGGAGPALQIGTVDEPALLTAEHIRRQGRTRPVDSAGGLAILPATAHPHTAIRLADALLDAGLSGVIGWWWPVPQPVAALMLLVLHSKLVDERLPAAEAVTAVQRWMLDPGRRSPVSLPAGHATTMAGTDLTDPALWAALWHRGSTGTPEGLLR